MKVINEKTVLTVKKSVVTALISKTATLKKFNKARGNKNGVCFYEGAHFMLTHLLNDDLKELLK